VSSARPGGDSSPTAAPSGRLQARAVTLQLGGRAVLQDVTAEFNRGWTAIVGPNGAGKSSLLRVLAGLLSPARGHVVLEAQSLYGAQPLAAPARARRIAWLAQTGELSGDLTVRETVALGRLPHLGLWRSPGAADEAAIDAAIALTACGDWQHRRLSTLSGGERQRALLARALATGADVLLLDEPTTHLDPPHQIAIARLARQLASTHTVVTVMHDLPLALAADRVLLLEQGCVRADGAASDRGLHTAISAAFGDALDIRWEDGRAVVHPRW
jgi:iron complex transport system ATP-binding protein